jgi:hypothetical protein
MTQDYIFCPFCGSTKWTLNKTKSINGELKSKQCSFCKKFTYVDITSLVEHKFLVGITQTTRFSVEAIIDKYRITVFYHNNSTQFQDMDSYDVILVVNSAVSFNWYKNEELLSKIKKYLVFS